jgi:hypothetical protein
MTITTPTLTRAAGASAVLSGRMCPPPTERRSGPIRPQDGIDRGPTLNIYDPMDCIVYHHMAREADPHAVPVTSGRSCAQLPSEYANRSPRTRLRRN